MNANAYRPHAANAQAEINVTPLIDVLLALVVILMIAAPLTMQKLPVPLGGGRSDATPPPRTARLAILSTGELFLDGNAVSRGQLGAVLSAWASSPAPPTLAIHADHDTRYELVAGTLDIAQHSGLAAIRIEGASE